MIITWAEAARQDIEDIHAYIARDSITSATKVVEAIVAATERLTLFPGMGRPGRQSGTRELIVPRLPYVVPYRVRRDRIVILRVLHTSRQRPVK